MTRYILVAFLPDTINYTLRAIREQFEPGVSQKIAPHISLTYPFWWPGKEEELIKKIAKAGSALKSFQAEVSEVKSFSREVKSQCVKLTHTGGVLGRHLRYAGEKMVIFLSVLPKEPFLVFHNKLTFALKTRARFITDNLPDKKLPENYTPHITLAIKGTDKDFIRLQELCARFIGYSFFPESIFLLKRKEKEQNWSVVSEFKL
ncbi:MAG: 2'-5' RNA ligase family protein [Patescibacteria group bacterium]|nr:2'-5' RNA ligase family protein [Patescibacteria group bacterium]